MKSLQSSVNVPARARPCIECYVDVARVYSVVRMVKRVMVDQQMRQRNERIRKEYWLFYSEIRWPCRKL
jgi:hypothetical protein